MVLHYKICNKIIAIKCCQWSPFPNKPWFLRVCSKPLFNTLGQGEIARNEQFLLSTVFSTCLESLLLIRSKLKLSSATSLSLEGEKSPPKFNSFGIDVKHGIVK